MPPVRCGGKPQLASCALAAQDKPPAVRKIHRNNTVASGVIHFIRIKILEPFRDLGHGFVNDLEKSALVHASTPSCARQIYRNQAGAARPEAIIYRPDYQMSSLIAP